MYFKTVSLPSGTNQIQAEISLRKAAIKETMSLDFKFKAVDIGTDKLFYGLEGKKDLMFTRLHTSFEFFLPKLIVSLSKHPDTNSYRVRPAAIPMAIIGLLGFALLIGLINTIRGLTDIERLSPFLIISLFYVILIYIELKITQAKVSKALNKVV